MALTYISLATTTLGSNQTTVTFDNISTEYSDLLLLLSVRSTGTQVSQDLYLKLNNTASGYSQQQLIANNGATVSASRTANQAQIAAYQIPAATSSSNSFSNFQIYIPNYRSTSGWRTVGIGQGWGLPSSQGYTSAVAGMWTTASAVTRIDLQPDSNQWAANSTFYLYGIKRWT